MESCCSLHVLVALMLILQSSNYHINASSSASTRPLNLHKTDTQYIKTSCKATTYPKLCYTSLSVYADKIKTDPQLLASAALNLSLAATRAASTVMNRLSKFHGLKPTVAAAVLDCVEMIGDSVDELQQSVAEMGRASCGESDFGLLMDDIETWVSAAMTDADTCMDGFDEHGLHGRVKNVVRRYVVKVAHLTSNALALINSYASTKSSSP
ncbi:hypothetical protein FNV43_RR09107 [Rhamnella rubrinervis]|uniref:Pectinesterase inhibitor domain-containing protein n=1 Tax=Rhamnella rubrinervis TaxID=2594499 RepID=A0A8K0HAL3_9ROSA|nr:hypothetical protein FNV43_RR09107 [Rhamnella rubrinervis]